MLGFDERHRGGPAIDELYNEGDDQGLAVSTVPSGSGTGSASAGNGSSGSLTVGPGSGSRDGTRFFRAERVYSVWSNCGGCYQDVQVGGPEGEKDDAVVALSL